MPCGNAITLTVQGKIARLPGCLPRTGWSLNHKGYLIYTSRRKGPIKRGSRAHRLVMSMLAGRPLLESEQVHHQDADKLNCLPANLILMPHYFNPSTARRDPYTGEFMSAGRWQRRYEGAISCTQSPVPDWVTSDNLLAA